jgi:hypothetical protein
VNEFDEMPSGALNFEEIDSLKFDYSCPSLAVDERRYGIDYKKVMSIKHPCVPKSWAQGVGRSNRPAPTNKINGLEQESVRRNLSLCRGL